MRHHPHFTALNHTVAKQYNCFPCSFHHHNNHKEFKYHTPTGYKEDQHLKKHHELKAKTFVICWKVLHQVRKHTLSLFDVSVMIHFPRQILFRWSNHRGWFWRGIW